MKPFFSVIIPTFNRANRVLQAIESIRQQSFADFEIIVVDDGSTDETGDVVGRVADERIKYFKKQNEERSIARNFGMRQAAGRYIGFLDSDDRFYSTHLQTAYNLLQKNNYPEVIHLGYEIRNDAGGEVKKINDFDDRSVERLIHENIFCCNAILFSREVGLKYPFLHHRDAVISEDWYFYLKLVSRYDVKYDNTITSVVVEHGERSLRNIDPEQLIASTEIIIAGLKKDEAFLKKYGRKVSYFFANQYTLVTLVLSLSKKRRWQTLAFLLKALKHDPTVLVRRRFLASIKHWF
jgi:glycosyltransferase involved in cell wall biosynthesis